MRINRRIPRALYWLIVGNLTDREQVSDKSSVCPQLMIISLCRHSLCKYKQVVIYNIHRSTENLLKRLISFHCASVHLTAGDMATIIRFLGSRTVPSFNFLLLVCVVV